MERFVDGCEFEISHEQERKEEEKQLKKIELEEQRKLLRGFQMNGNTTPDFTLIENMSKLLARFRLRGLTETELKYLGALSDKYKLGLNLVGYSFENAKIDESGNKTMILGGYTEEVRFCK